MVLILSIWNCTDLGDIQAKWVFFILFYIMIMYQEICFQQYFHVKTSNFEGQRGFLQKSIWTKRGHFYIWISTDCTENLFDLKIIFSKNPHIFHGHCRFDRFWRNFKINHVFSILFYTNYTWKDVSKYNLPDQ
jgi:hypothetical protein